jgi:hypothetical protein
MNFITYMLGIQQDDKRKCTQRCTHVTQKIFINQYLRTKILIIKVSICWYKDNKVSTVPKHSTLQAHRRHKGRLQAF